jgi:hypothetical protein
MCAPLPEPKFETTGFFMAIFPRQTGDGPIKLEDDSINDPINDLINLHKAIITVIENQEGLSALDISKHIGRSVS